MLRETVVNGAFVARNELKPNEWNGVPVTIHHPQDDNGNFISAASDEILDQYGVGVIQNAALEGDKLRAEACIDVERCEELAPGLVAALLASEPCDVSTGYFAKSTKRAGVYGAKKYETTHHNLRPDHLALLPGDVGACSWADGCGVRANRELDSMNVSELTAALRDALGIADPKKKLVAGLIANKTAPFVEADQAHLLNMSTAALEGLAKQYSNAEVTLSKKPETEADFVALGYDAAAAKRMVEAAKPVVTANANAPLTAEAIAALVTNGITEGLKAIPTAVAAALAESKRPEYLAKVIANTAYTKEQAEALPTATLEVLANAIKPVAAVKPNAALNDYSVGRVAPNVNGADGKPNDESAKVAKIIPLGVANSIAADKAAKAS